MNDSIIAQHAQAHKLITDSLGLNAIDEENERRHNDEDYAEFRVPVTVTRQGFMTFLAPNAEAARRIANAAAAFTDDLEEVVQTELIGRAAKL